MVKYGTTTKQLGAVAVTCRGNACLNERAMMRTPMTMEDYEKAPVIAEPFRVFDCCLQSDGACAVVVTSAERAKELKQKPVYIMGAAEGSGPYGRGGMWGNYWPDHAECYAKYVAPDLFNMAGVTPRDIDVAEIYDCFTYSVIVQLEDFGFCKKGEGGAFVEGGRIQLGGELPINTCGGLLSEAYIHGLNLVVEAVSQLRGDAGSRQVKDAEIALVTAGGAATTGSALILRR
jgi:acetyl-CoA acetyltransferase